MIQKTFRLIVLSPLALRRTHSISCIACIFQRKKNKPIQWVKGTSNYALIKDIFAYITIVHIFLMLFQMMIAQD